MMKRHMIRGTGVIEGTIEHALVASLKLDLRARLEYMHFPAIDCGPDRIFTLILAPQDLFRPLRLAAFHGESEHFDIHSLHFGMDSVLPSDGPVPAKNYLYEPALYSKQMCVFGTRVLVPNEYAKIAVRNTDKEIRVPRLFLIGLTMPD